MATLIGQDAATSFGATDWLVVGAYLMIVLTLGVVCSRRRTGTDDLFLAGRSMPVWAVAISVLATSQSAATFVGGPQEAYSGNLTYLAANIGPLLAVCIVAVLFIPAYYRHNVTSVYELIGYSHGPTAQRSASAMFMIGRVFASGARLFIVSLPFAAVAFGNTAPKSLLVSIVLIVAAAVAYTMAGGIRAVIWTDVLQACLYVISIGIALWVLLDRLPIGIGEAIDALAETGDRAKLVIIDTRPSMRSGLDGVSEFLSRPFSLPAILVGLTLFNLAAFGTDQDLTQRMLTCRTARRGSASAILSMIIGWPIVAMFMLMGLLLYVYYQRPDIMGDAAPTYAVDNSREVFLEFILHEMPTGLRGLMMAGLFAAAMSSLDSALNAMASTTVADFVRPWRRRRNPRGEVVENDTTERRVSRLAMLLWACMLGGFASVCVFWQQHSGETLIAFALGVMVFAYSGLLAVFLATLLTRRGNALSVCAALATGFLATLLLQRFFWESWMDRLGVVDGSMLPRLAQFMINLAFGWKMVVATTASFLVCVAGRKPRVTVKDG